MKSKLILMMLAMLLTASAQTNKPSAAPAMHPHEVFYRRANAQLSALNEQYGRLEKLKQKYSDLRQTKSALKQSHKAEDGEIAKIKQLQSPISRQRTALMGQITEYEIRYPDAEKYKAAAKKPLPKPGSKPK